MAKVNSTVSTVALSAVLALGASAVLSRWIPPLSLHATDAIAQTAAKPQAQWAASATGRVEPKDGEVRITAEAAGRIDEVLVKTNDRVKAGDLIALIDSDDLMAKLPGAVSEVLVREREREEDPAKGLAEDRRKAEDNVAAAERALFRARMSADDAYRAWKTGKGTEETANTSRDALKSAEDKLATDRATLATVNAKADMPLPTRLESALLQARSDVTQLETAIARTRVRAPAEGTILTVWAKAGELAAPSAEAPLALFGDLTSMRVRAEVEERDVPKIRVGQRAVVRADAYPDKEFEGIVSQVAQALGAPRITSRGPRRPNDVEVLEVLVALDGNPPLLTGMRVDVFFRQEGDAAAVR